MTTPKELLLKTLKFEEPERVPHFESVFEPAYEAFGVDYPSEKELAKASGKELDRLIGRLVEIYTLTAEKYDWAAVHVFRPWAGPLVGPVIKELKKAVGHRSLVGGFIGNATWSLESVTDYMKFSIDLYERPELLKQEAQENADRAIREGQAHVDAGAEILYLPNDWGYNDGLFFSRAHFDEFVTPYLNRIVHELKKLGVVVVLHSDGYIMDILDVIIDTGADMLQSIDPLAGMDIAEVKKITYGKIALQGNVNAVFLQEGTKEQVREAAEYCLENASPGGGYVFGSSNSIFKSANLELYDEMLDVHRNFNNKTLK